MENSSNINLMVMDDKTAKRIFGLALVGAGTIIGGCVYVGYKAYEKASEIIYYSKKAKDNKKVNYRCYQRR